MAYSEDYRKRTVEFYHEGNTQTKVREIFKVDPKTLLDWEIRYAAGELKPNYPKTRKSRKLEPDALIAYHEENPDDFLYEIGDHFGCSGEAVRKAFKKLGITRKKRHITTKSDAKSNEPNMRKR